MEERGWNLQLSTHDRDFWGHMKLSKSDKMTKDTKPQKTLPYAACEFWLDFGLGKIKDILGITEGS